MDKKDERFWETFAAEVRKDLGYCHLTPAQAQVELDKLKPADELPFTDAEIERAIDKVLRGDLEPEIDEPDTSWSPELDAATVGDFAMNRNLGDEDPEVDAQVDELRRKALDEGEDDQDGPGLAGRAEPPPERG